MIFINSKIFRNKIIVLTLALTSLFIFISRDVFATHNRAGEITYRRIGPNQIEAKIVTYTKTSSLADRPELEFWWGDGDRDTLPRHLPIEFNVGPDIQRNTYYGIHTYPGTGLYVMYFLDENRNAGVINLPGSVNIPFYVQTQLLISPFVTANNSPQLLEPPIDDGVVGSLFIHNPNAFDPDGDSLSYELTPCKGVGGLPIPNYSLPSASSSFTLDAVTGDMVWDSPQTIGEYNVAMIIREWRNFPGIGVLNIGYVTRDMQITIYAPRNNPPVITSIIDTCIEAGDVLNLTVNATDPNGDVVTLTASGGPFSVGTSQATFSSTPSAGTVTGNFSWSTVCAHIRKNPYTVVFKARDDNDTTQLADLEQVFITVVAPAPQNPFLVPQGNSMILHWDQSLCPQAVGYKIYRRVSQFGFLPSHCETGVPGYTGYSYIGLVNGLTTTTFTDNNNGLGLSPAVNYCYMVTAFYPDAAESYASVEFCGILIKDLPVITNVDVTQTSITTGQIYTAWSKPTQLDFTQTPGPFRYVLQRATGTGSFTDVVTFTSLNDTVFTDSGLNTTTNQYNYRVQFWNDTPGNIFQIGNTQTASSIFLTTAPGDEKNNLSWNLNVPWLNTNYLIFRQHNGGLFNLVDSTTAITYTDDSLINGDDYCYYIQSVGAYGDSGIINPILNRSEIYCSVPVDNEPPCTPTLSISANCEMISDTISWLKDNSCAGDVASYQLYHAPPESSDFTLVATIPEGTNVYVYTNSSSVSGCYYITATDSNGNVSLASNQICTESCPTYELPNVFTPDNNGVNDLFHPFHPYRDVKDVDMKIFNRWGGLMFTTTDPEIGWNGTLNNNGTPDDIVDGVYFYVCTVNEIYLEGIVPRVLTGTVTIIRGKIQK